jgi:hypothetical protein
MFKFLVYSDSERLKYSRCGMKMGTRGSWRYTFDSFSQVGCCTKWRCLSHPDKRTGETASGRFFTQFTEYTLEFLHASIVEDIDSTKRLPLVHAHV